MRFQLLAAISVLFAAASALDEPLDIKIEKSVECTRKSQKGDKVKVHYRGTLASDGTQFDASYDRGSPLEFHVGKGQVIKGWDEGLLDMCIGDKRTLTIQPEWAYGSRPMGPIPANSVLIFETELMGIGGVQAEKEL